MLFTSITITLVACTNESSIKSENTTEYLNKTYSKLVVGTAASFAPFEYVDESGNIKGIEMEILQAIREEMGIDFEIRNIGWDSVFQQVESGEIDVGVSAITITEERKKTFDFTEPYYEASQLIIVKEESDVRYLNDLKDKKIAVQQNTTGFITAQSLQGAMSPNILTYESLPFAIEQVVNGNADGAIGDNAVIFEYIKNHPNEQLESVEDTSFKKEYYGFMVKKGNDEILQLLNEGIKKIKDNGKLERITGQEIK